MFFLIITMFPPLYDASEFGFGNIRRFRKQSILITYQELFQLKETRSTSFSYNRKNYSIRLIHFGSDLYRELTVELNYRKYLENLWFGLEPSLLYLSQSGDTYLGGTAGLFGGFRWKNYSLSVISRNSISYLAQETLPVEMEVSSVYENEWNEIGLKVNFLEQWGMSLGFGYKLIFPDMRVGVGLITNPEIPTFSFSLDVGRVTIDAGYQNHPNLGLSQTYTVIYND